MANLHLIIQGGEAERAAAKLSTIFSASGENTSITRIPPSELPDAARKVIDPLTLAGVILAIVHWFHANFATVYAPSYREDRFAQVRIGMTRQEVNALLGTPLRNTPLPGESWRLDECWVYSRPPGPGYWGDNYWRRWIFFGPGKDDKVKAIVNDYYED